MTDIYNIASPLLFRLDPERAHDITLRLMKAGLGPRIPAVEDPALRVTLWDKVFPNPVGIAAGFDKNAEIIGPLLRLGFGFAEIGTVTPKPQHGNPKPRIFRAADHHAIINRMGFPNQGLNRFKTNLHRFLDARPRPAGLVGINIGMNKSQTDPAKDYCLLLTQLGPFADYLTINISSPNTPGLRNLQDKDSFTALCTRILDERAKSCGIDPPPVLVKFAPDLTETQLGELAAAVLNCGIDGVILTNTTLARPPGLPERFAAEKGGLSGLPLQERSTALIRNFYRLTKGKVPIIGLGGICDAADAYAKIRAGATLVQLYSALVFQGPSVVKDINTGLLALLKQDGFAHISEAVGADHRGRDGIK